MSRAWLPSLMPPFWKKKRKSSSTIDFFLVLRLVNYINNSQQQHQQKKIRWSSSTVRSAPFLCWRSARQVVFFLFSFFPFTALLQFCSRQSLAAWQFYCTPSPRITTRWNHCLEVGSQWDMACMLMTAQGGGALYSGRASAKPPCQCELQKQQFAESSGRSPCNHFTSYSADSKVTKHNFFFFFWRWVDASEANEKWVW